MEALHRLKSTEPPQWLAPSAPLSEAARAACQHLFTSLRPHVRKSPFDELLVDNFDAEQIYQQIDLLTQPLVRSIRRRVKHWERNPEEIENLLPKVADGGKKVSQGKKMEELDDDEDGDMDLEDDDDDEGDEEGMDVDNDGGKDEGDESEDEEEEEEKGGGIEDKFLKIKELQEHLEDEEARHYGLDPKKKKSKKKSGSKRLEDEDDDNEEDEEGEEDDEEEEEELDLFAGGDDEDDDDEMGNARYEDFFGKTKGASEKKPKFKDELGEDTSSDEEEEEKKLSSDDEEEDENANEKPKVLSTHEKEVQKIKSEIEKMEKANLDPKTWTMQGEVTAANRPKNSALEVDLDFEHNVRPVPVITEEVTQSLEEIIKKRIIEEQFDDIKKAPGLPSKAPRELKQVEDNKSNKGLAEVYEEEYVQQTDPTAAPLSFSDEQKEEASTLFKKLCLKLDALSHFHFAPKPVIEDMSIQTNVPALAMEEIAPVAVSDAAMLAPEEVFSGKGNVKAEVELTQAERKRRRAKKKRKFKAVETKKNASKKAREDELRKQKEAAGNVEEQ